MLLAHEQLQHAPVSLEPLANAIEKSYLARRLSMALSCAARACKRVLHYRPAILGGCGILHSQIPAILGQIICQGTAELPRDRRVRLPPAWRRAVPLLESARLGGPV